MKLHRLTLTNYRGITHRDIEFPDHGVVVVSGANEVGKTSMLEALDLLLEAKDRSTKKEVKQVKPTHADVGAEVTAEISTGPYRFVYRKRFHKRPETELTVLAPRREQLTGDEAHDRVRSMLAETMDMDLWQAQRVLQSASTAAADLSGCDALSRALDVAAGEVDDAVAQGSAGGVDELLIDRIEGEYRRYFTATGRPTGEWAAATTRLRIADEQAAQCAAGIAEVDEAVRRHAALTTQLSELEAESADAAQRLAVARTAAQAVEALRNELSSAAILAEAAAAKHSASQEVLTERLRVRTDIDERTAAVARLEGESDAAAEELAIGTEVHEAAESAAAQAYSAMQAGQQRVETARRAVQMLADREEADRLAAQLAALERHHRDLDVAQHDLAAVTMTAELMAAIEDAAASVDRAGAAAELASAQIELIAQTELDVTVGDTRMTLRAGQSWSSGVTGPASVDVPGVLSMQVVPGASAAATQAALDSATATLAQLLEQGGVADVEAARAVDHRRRELSACCNEKRAILQALTPDDDVDGLRARLSELQAGLQAQDDESQDAVAGSQDPAVLRAELAAATADGQRLAGDAETHRKVAEQAAKQVTERGLAAARAKEKLHAAVAELTLAGQRLAEQRAGAGDDELAAAAEAAAAAALAAEETVERLGAELARHQPDLVDSALEQAQRHHDRVHGDRDRLDEARREVATQLKVYGTEGRKGRLDAAETERQHAEAEFQRVQRRARAAQLLRTVMMRHRDATRMRYVDPYRSEVERLGRMVFGDTFEVEVDSELRIGQRTLSGRTVPYESLSGGAKEQLGIVARLASAALVAKEDGVPVVIDDALGFADAERLAKMADVFDTVAGDGQVIVLTCSPQRYSGIRSAQHITLGA